MYVSAMLAKIGRGPADYTVPSDAGAVKARSLWNDTTHTNDAPPSGWQDIGFDDSGWADAVRHPGSIEWFPGSHMIWVDSRHDSWQYERGIYRHAFTLPSGTVLAGRLWYYGDDLQEGAWLNGTYLGQEISPTTWSGGVATLGPNMVAQIDPALFVEAGLNVLALQVQNDNGLGGDYTNTSPAWAVYLLEVWLEEP